MVIRVEYEKDNKSIVIKRIPKITEKENEHVIRIRDLASDDGTVDFDFVETNIVQYFVPLSGIYKLEAWGATGGSNSTTTGPKGAYSRSYVYLKKDEILEILVGEKGYPGYNNGIWKYCGGGGGGTFISKGREPLCVAGGGGSFVKSSYSSVSSFACGQSSQYGGNPGTGQGELRKGGKGYSTGGGGAGFEGNGEDGTDNMYGKGGISFLNGGSRQTKGTYAENIGYGGFGGGGSRHGCCGYSAGGGCYSGGSASSSFETIQGGGGGSYHEGKFNNEPSFAISGCDTSLPTNPGSNGNGYAIITLLKSTKDPDLVHLQLPCSNYKGRFLWTLYSTLSPYRL